MDILNRCILPLRGSFVYVLGHGPLLCHCDNQTASHIPHLHVWVGHLIILNYSGTISDLFEINWTEEQLSMAHLFHFP